MLKLLRRCLLATVLVLPAQARDVAMLTHLQGKVTLSAPGQKATPAQALIPLESGYTLQLAPGAKAVLFLYSGERVTLLGDTTPVVKIEENRLLSQGKPIPLGAVRKLAGGATARPISVNMAAVYERVGSSDFSVTSVGAFRSTPITLRWAPAKDAKVYKYTLQRIATPDQVQKGETAATELTVAQLQPGQYRLRVEAYDPEWGSKSLQEAAGDVTLLSATELAPLEALEKEPADPDTLAVLATHYLALGLFDDAQRVVDQLAKSGLPVDAFRKRLAEQRSGK